MLVPTLRPEGVGSRQGVVPEPVQKGTMPVQPSVLPPPVLVPTLRQCEARNSKTEQFAGRLLESRRGPTKQEICALFGLLPCDSPSAPASSNLAAVCSFRTGMISREDIPLLADACHEYPLTTEIMTSFVRSVMPGHRFTTVVIYCNVSTKMHRDTDNESTTSGVVALSRFEGGEIWVESPEGEVTQMVEGSLVRGKLLCVGSRPVFLVDEEGSERVEKFRSEDCGNSGPLLSLEWDGQLEPVSDGFGLCSPTRWPPEARGTRLSERAKGFSQAMFNVLESFVEQVIPGPKRTAFELALGRLESSPFSLEQLRGLRTEWFQCIETFLGGV